MSAWSSRSIRSMSEALAGARSSRRSGLHSWRPSSASSLIGRRIRPHYAGRPPKELPMSAEPSFRSELAIAVFVDFENLALGVEQHKKRRFEIELVLKRLLGRGRIVFKRAYCDWTRFKDFMHEFHRQGFEMVDIPSSKVSGKNSADIRMVVDAI